MPKQANTIDFKTIIFVILGLILPFWPVSLPLFWFLAYRAYRKGEAPGTSLADLADAQRLLDAGTITQAEFDEIRARYRSR